MFVVRYTSAVGAQLKGPGLMTAQAIWPLQGQKPQETLVPHACKSICCCLPDFGCQDVSCPGIEQQIVDTIIDEQGYNSPHALSHLDQKGIMQLVSAIHKPGGMKEGTHKLDTIFPL